MSEPATVGWTANDATFGARLILIRQRKHWGNVKEAALACRTPVESWRTWERDNVKPRNYEEICRQISQLTGCDLDWLMRGPQRGESLPRVDSNHEPIGFRLALVSSPKRRLISAPLAA